eukprot:NODE_10713_length_579_cov_116.464912_g10436_i0.p1 GENE.NODE_10713_length_579_cov_116.464912_g10436_i0~~NODE_10713_length_579_cov_116.464912_g10436_i0.p1  ORF type:complete len:141 (+),score=28.80 NODE_10713_length_579_cov_116.464912_g10436_i0:64-486(+)
MPGIVFNAVCNCVSFLWPAWTSFRLLAGKPTPFEANTLLMYWLIFALFYVAETPFSFILGFIPLYANFKLAFLIWLQVPHTKGAKLVYDYIQPMLLQLKEPLDMHFKKVQDMLKSFVPEQQGATAPAPAKKDPKPEPATK